MVALGGFRLEATLGEGGMARVWRGAHIASGTPVAIKVLAAPHGAPAYVLSFKNEIEAVARLDHVGIARVLDFGEVPEDAAADGELTARSPYIVMELAPDGSLDRGGAPETWPELEALLLALLDALAHAHARGVVHRDLKPANVLIDRRRPTPRYLLTDFGLARARALNDEATDHASWASSGTPPFMAPEQLTGAWRDQGPWTDLYALGCVAYALASGAPPFVRDDVRDVARAHLTEPPPPLVPTMDVPRGFEGWLHGLLAKQPAERFALAADARHALGQLAGAPMIAAARPSLPLAATAPTTMPDGTVPIRVPSQVPATPISERFTSPTLVEREPPPIPEDWRVARDEEPAQLGAGLALFGLRTPPLVDRDLERDALWSALGDTSSLGASRVVVLRGATGSGKTRLATWIAERAHEVGAALALFATHSARSGPRHGVMAMVARALGSQQLHGAALVERLGHALATLGDADAALRDALAELLSPRSDAALLDDAAAKEHERHRILLRLLGLMSRERALVVVLDDAHWGFDALRLARAIIYDRGALESLPVLVVVTVCDEALAADALEARELSALIADGASAITLGNLASADQLALVKQLVEGLSGALVERVAQRTGGHPAFAVQLIGDWVARGILIATPSGLELLPDADVELPDDMHMLCEQRIALAIGGRDHAERHAVELAAALGNEVDEAEWLACCRHALLTPAHPLLDALARQGLLEPMLGGWRFSHGVIRETLERGAVDGGRAAGHHRCIADVLRARRDAGTAEPLARVAHHLVAAGDLDDACAPLLRAARMLRIQGAFERAAALLSERDAVLDALGARDADPRRAEGELMLALMLGDRQRHDEAVAIADRIAALAHAEGWPAIEARAWLRRADAAAARSDYEASHHDYRRALDTLVAYGDRQGEFEARQGVAEALYHRGDRVAAGEAYAENLALGRALDDELAIAESRWGLGYVRMWQGDLDDAREHFSAMRDILERRGAAYRLADAYNALGELARLGHHYAEAEGFYRHALGLNEVYGTRGGLANRLNIAISRIFQGDVDSAERMLPDLLADATRLNSHHLMWGALPIALVTRARAGQWTAWDSACEQLEAGLADTGFKDGDVALMLEMAAAHAHNLGEHDRARRTRLMAIAQWRALGRDDRVAALLALVPTPPS